MISHFIFAQASAESAGPIENLRQIGEQTGFSLPHLISQAIAFLIVAAGLTYFAYNPVRNILEERRKAIEQGIADADRSKKELADAQEARRKVLQKANEQAETIIAEAHKAATIRAEQRTREATAQAEDIIRKAHEAAALDRDKLMAELKREIGSLVIQTTSKVAGKVLNVLRLMRRCRAQPPT